MAYHGTNIVLNNNNIIYIHTVSFLCVLGLQKQLEISSYSKLSDAHTAIPPHSLHSQGQILANVIQKNGLVIPNEPRKKKRPYFQSNPGCLIGILISWFMK